MSPQLLDHSADTGTELNGIASLWSHQEENAQWHSPTKRVRGITLIELLVVMTIIALLISILLPSLALFRFSFSRVSPAQPHAAQPADQ